MNCAAVILCAGKGTRMNDDSRNKVAFECAGIPVIKRIVLNMKDGGVSHFVIVVGHKAQTVMEALKDVDGVTYVYQAEQKGTGHAALCGLKALQETGFEGRAVISMGDKIISPEIIASLVEKAQSAKAVWSVQPVEQNFNGGRVVMKDGKPYGVVEFADAALMALAGVEEGERENKLTQIGLNKSKHVKVLKKAAESNIKGVKNLNGVDFSAEQILQTKYANAGFYCFDVACAIEAIKASNADNAQGEIYLTDLLEYFARTDDVAVNQVNGKKDMLTFSTKPELREISKRFMRTAGGLKADIENGKLDEQLENIYGKDIFAQKERYIALLQHFINVYGDKLVVITRSPGRVNLMGRHIDHRGGSLNVIASDCDTLMVASPRDDDTVNLTNLAGEFQNRQFSISDCLNLAKHEEWLEYLDAEPVKNALAQTRGDWVNYVKSAVLRFQLASNMALCGMDVAVYGNIPKAAGVSSSSSVVVATAEAVVALNAMNLTDTEFVTLCGEGEWFVGSRGGAGDHAAMKCCKRGKITHLGFKPFFVGESVDFCDKYAVIVADSGLKAQKSAGSMEKFNAKVATYEISFMIIKRFFPDYDLKEFRDLIKIPEKDIYKILLKIPEKANRAQILGLIPESTEKLNRLFKTHESIQEYSLRGVTLFGIAECLRAEKCVEVLADGDYKLFGEIMNISHDGDRVASMDLSNEAVERMAKENLPIYKQPGAYECSLKQIDDLCDMLNATEGVLGSELAGAGFGGCVIALVEKEYVDKIVDKINKEYYDANGFEHNARVYSPSSGSAVLF